MSTADKAGDETREKRRMYTKPLEGNVRWWRVYGVPFDRASERALLGYHYGTRSEAVEAGKSMTGHDAWGSTSAYPLYLEDVSEELVKMAATIRTSQAAIEQLTIIRESIRNEMGQ